MKKSKNYLRIGLKSDKKLKNSFYSFLYEKHFDWAIIIAAFFTPLPYISSKEYWLILIKVLLFSIIVYCCLRYIINWKKLQDYYKQYEKLNEKSNALIDKEKLKKNEEDKFNKFTENFIAKLKEFGESFIGNNESLVLNDYIKKYPEKTKPLVDLINEDIKLFSTLFGVVGKTYGVLLHLSSIPKQELKNYHRLLLIILLLILFFIVYALEIYLL